MSKSKKTRTTEKELHGQVICDHECSESMDHQQLSMQELDLEYLHISSKCADQYSCGYSNKESWDCLVLCILPLDAPPPYVDCMDRPK